MPTSSESLLAQLADACTHPTDIPTLLTRALPHVLLATGAESAYVLHAEAGETKVNGHSGKRLPLNVLASDWADPFPGWRRLTIPSAWHPNGVRSAVIRPLSPDPSPLLLMLTFGREPADADLLGVVGSLLEVAVSGAQSAAELSDLTRRVNNAQQLANMGDYDWHIASDTNHWSDQLYRIYGHEPQSFNATYERFIAHLHPDDRERIMEIHQQAYASGEPYQMIERVQRSGGESRYLSTNGQVIMDEEGTPVRMRGTCIDITDLILSEQAAERASARFQALVEASDDAIMVVEGGLVVQTNDRGRALLGGDPVGLPLDRFMDIDGTTNLGIPGRGLLPGQALTLDVSTSELNPGADDHLVAVFVRDAAPRLASEALAVSLRESQVRQRQAVEINDNIIQGLTAAVYCLEDSDRDAAGEYVQITLASARSMMTDLLEPLDGEELKPGDLVRESATTLRGSKKPSPESSATVPVSAPGVGDRRVLIVDDSEDMRMLERLFLERKEGVTVVGEAATGREGVELAQSLQPDLVLLDLSMPDMDGLEALPHILTSAPATKVIVLSGFDRSVAAQALRLGASSFVQKGGGLQELMRAVDQAVPMHTELRLVEG